MRWVEQGEAPAAIVQHGADGNRMTYPYPDRERRVDQGRSEQVAGEWQTQPLEWLGSGFFVSGCELR